MLHEALDRAALARRIATFEHHDDSLPGLLDPALHFEKLDLQFFLVSLVGGLRILVLYG